jgi:hypothetical protein
MNNEELQEKFEQLASEMDWIKTKLVDLLEEKGLAPVKTSYEVKVPEDIGTYYTINARGELQSLNFYPDFIREQIYKRGEAFEISDNAILYGKEKLLLKKMEDWAEEQNEGWYPIWENGDDKFYIIYFHNSESFSVCSDWNCSLFNKLPYFKSEELAREFIKEFGEEIKEVLL